MKPPQLSLRAIITKTDDGFIVSVAILLRQGDPTVVGEKFVSTLDAAHSFVEQLAHQMGSPPESIKKMYY
jgi:hypothetical protein